MLDFSDVHRVTLRQDYDYFNRYVCWIWTFLFTGTHGAWIWIYLQRFFMLARMSAAHSWNEVCVLVSGLRKGSRFNVGRIWWTSLQWTESSQEHSLIWCKATCRHSFLVDGDMFLRKLGPFNMIFKVVPYGMALIIVPLAWWVHLYAVGPEPYVFIWLRGNGYCMGIAWVALCKETLFQNTCRAFEGETISLFVRYTESLTDATTVASLLDFCSNKWRRKLSCLVLFLTLDQD